MWKAENLNVLPFTPQAPRPVPRLNYVTDPRQHYCPQGYKEEVKAFFAGRGIRKHTRVGVSIESSQEAQF